MPYQGSDRLAPLEQWAADERKRQQFVAIKYYETMLRCPRGAYAGSDPSAPMDQYQHHTVWEF